MLSFQRVLFVRLGLRGTSALFPGGSLCAGSPRHHWYFTTRSSIQATNVVSLVGYLTVLVQQLGLAAALSVAYTLGPVSAAHPSVAWGGLPPFRRALWRTLRRGLSVVDSPS